jgi:hypothetical protein
VTFSSNDDDDDDDDGGSSHPRVEEAVFLFGAHTAAVSLSLSAGTKRRRLLV